MNRRGLRHPNHHWQYHWSDRNRRADLKLHSMLPVLFGEQKAIISHYECI